MKASLDPERWLGEYGDDLYRYALFALGRESDAEDAVQDTFLAAIKALETYSGKSSEKTWLFGILNEWTVNPWTDSRSLDTSRKRSAEKVHPRLHSLSLPGSACPFVGEKPKSLQGIF